MQQVHIPGIKTPLVYLQSRASDQILSQSENGYGHIEDLSAHGHVIVIDRIVVAKQENNRFCSVRLFATTPVLSNEYYYHRACGLYLCVCNQWAYAVDRLWELYD